MSKLACNVLQELLTRIFFRAQRNQSNNFKGSTKYSKTCKYFGVLKHMRTQRLTKSLFLNKSKVAIKFQIQRKDQKYYSVPNLALFLKYLYQMTGFQRNFDFWMFLKRYAPTDLSSNVSHFATYKLDFLSEDSERAYLLQIPNPFFSFCSNLSHSCLN